MIECSHITAVIDEKVHVYLVANMKHAIVSYAPKWEEIRVYRNKEKAFPFLNGENIATQERATLQTFFLMRVQDVSGVSGTGKVAHGILFPNGPVVLEWLRNPYAINTYENVDDLLSIHGHNGATKLVWENMR